MGFCHDQVQRGRSDGESKRAAVASAEKLLRTKTKELAKTKLEVEQLSEELTSLTEQFQEKTSNQKRLKKKALKPWKRAYLQLKSFWKAWSLNASDGQKK